MVLCVNKPLEDMSRWRAASLLRPRWKWCRRTWSSKERFGPKLIRLMNLAQDAPNISFSFCWKVRTSICRAAIRERGKKARQNLSRSSSQFSFMPPMVWAYHCFALPKRENENNFHLMVYCVMPKKLDKNTSAQIPEGGCKDFRLLTQSRVAPEPWL